MVKTDPRGKQTHGENRPMGKTDPRRQKSYGENTSTWETVNEANSPTGARAIRGRKGPREELTSRGTKKSMGETAPRDEQPHGETAPLGNSPVITPRPQFLPWS